MKKLPRGIPARTLIRNTPGSVRRAHTEPGHGALDLGPLPLPGRDGSARVSRNLWDAIIGVRGQYRFGQDRRWFLPYYWDIGTGEVHFSPRWKSMIGYAEDELENVFSTWEERLHPQDRGRALALSRRLQPRPARRQ